jgi:multidrug efflux pump subunit AcrA (membrane-fusion protein)
LGAASQQEEEEVAATHAAHESHVRAAREKLTLLGASDRQIAALQQAEQINPNLVVPAPISGVVLMRSANLGLVVNTAQELFTVVDLSTVWIMASVSEKDFASVRVGSPASLTAPAYPGRAWRGRVTYIQPQVDSTTRTAQAHIEVTNPGEDLRIDMYVDVEFTFWALRGQSCRKPPCNPSANVSMCFSLSKTTKEAFNCVRSTSVPQQAGIIP